MKSCLGSLLLLLTMSALIATGGLIWYLSSTARFAKKEAPSAIPADQPAEHRSNR